MKAQGRRYVGRRRIQAALPMLAALAATGSMAIAATPAAAGTWMQISCPHGTDSTSPAAGWSTFSAPNQGKYDGVTAACGADSQGMMAWLSRLEPAQLYDNENLEYEPPANSTLDGGWLELEEVAPGHGPGAYAEVAVSAPGFGSPFWSCRYDACPEGTHNSYVGQVNIPPGTGGDLYVSTICQGTEGSTCEDGENSIYWAAAQVREAHMLLSNAATPAANGFAGSLLEGSARGIEDLSLTANDPNGPGVYSIKVEIEGTTAYIGTPNINGGSCVPTGTTNNGVLMFASPQPCLASEAVKVPVETAGVPDGQHSVKVKVIDAAQNSTTVFAGNITTDNAPVASTSPAIVAANGVTAGVALSSSPGQWSAPSGSGSITDVYQWQQCSATGKECQAIPGATAPTYTPTPGDAGHTLKLAVTAVNDDGQASEETAATAIVAVGSGSAGNTDPPSNAPGPSTQLSEASPLVSPGASNGTPASTGARIELGGRAQIALRESRSAFEVSGRLTTSSGQPILGATIDVLSQVLGTTTPTVIAHVTTGTGGVFTAQVPAGSSRTITFAYRAFANEPNYAAVAKINESVAAAITLSITPKRVERSGTITITGQVLGFIPPRGVKLALEVFFHGRWVSMPATRTRSDGRFRLRYQFQHAKGIFPFRVRALSDDVAFPYSAGTSRRVDVRTG
jgi:hypothetical protein